MTILVRAMWACVFLLSLSGCAQTPPPWAEWSSWFGNKNVEHSSVQNTKDGLAPPPKAAPIAPVQMQPIAPPTFTKIKVGLLLPLSGPDATLGQAMLNAAEQAAYDTGVTNFELMPRDTGSSEELAATAANEALASGAQILVGPLFGSQVPTVYAVANPMGISMLTLSTDTSLAKPGLYVMGFAPEAQAQRIAHFAAAHGMHHFAAIVPSSAYGTRVGQAFLQAVTKSGGAMDVFETYDPSQHDTSSAVREIVERSGSIDALFLPEGGEELATIMRQLTEAKFDFRKVHLLGTGLWDAPDTAQQAKLAVGGWYAAPDPAVRQNYISSYTTTYGEAPPRLTTLAYDAVALTAVLAKRGARFDEASLTNRNGFAGLDGIFRLKPDGEVDRGLAVLELTPSLPRLVDHAPTVFSNNR